MAQAQLVQFGFHTGVDEKTDPKSAPPGTIVDLVNMRQGKTGQLERRYGHTALTKNILGGGTLSACKRLAARKNELLLSDGTTLYGYSETLTDWITRGKVPNCVSRFDIVKQFDSDWADPQYAYANGLEVFSCTLSPNRAILAFVRDVVSGTIVSQPLLVAPPAANFYQSAVCITGNYAVVCLGDSGGVIRASIMDLTNISAGWSSLISLETDAISGSPLSIRELSTNHFLLVYAQSAAGPTQQPRAIECTVTSASAITVNTVANIGTPDTTIGAFCLDLDVANNVAYFGYSQSSNFFVVVSFNATTLATVHLKAQATSGQAGYAGIIVMATADIRILTIFGGAVKNVYYTTDNTLGTLTQAGQFYFGHIKTNLWKVGSSVYVVARYAKTNFVCEVISQATSTNGPMRPACTLVPRTAYASATEASGEATINMALPRVYSAGNNHYRAIGTQIADASSNSRNGLVIHDLTFGDDWIENGAKYPAQHLQPVEFGSLLHLSGGVPCSYDGNRLVEMSFLFGPQNADIPNPTPAGGATNALSNGVYQYMFTYEWTDDSGNIYRSEPSQPISVTTSAGGTSNKVTWTIPNLFLTLKSTYPTTGIDSSSTQVAVIAYRTTANGDGSLFYRQTPYTVPAGNLSTTGGQYVTIVDTTSDATLTASATASLLYTNGGTLAWQSPPSLTSLIKHRRRLCGIGDDGRTVWFSSEFVDREAPKWNDALQIEFDESLTALASMDDRLLAFSRDSVWFITGDGPNELDQGSDWSPPVRVQSDSGCIDPRSVISQADGVMFRSFTGFYFIDRQLNVSYIGGLIEDTADSNPLDVCSLFQAHGETSCFVSVVATSGASTGLRLHWDTYRKMWAKDKMTDGATTSCAVAGLTSWKGSVVWATPGGQVYQQVTTQWTDGASWYNSSFTTAFISSGGPLGWQRVRFVQMDGDYLTPHDIKLSLAFDFDDNFYQAFTWKAETQAVNKDVDVKMRVGSQNGANPRCQGLKLKYEMLTPSTPSDYPIGTGQAATMSGVGLMIVPKSGVRRVGAGESV